MALIMGILNLSPESFWKPGNGDLNLINAPVDILDIGAISTHPGADPVGAREEWRRLKPALEALPEGKLFSVDTVRSSIVRKVFKLCGPFIVNDISAGEDDPLMLETVAELGLTYIAMHKRGTPKTMDSLCDYPDGVMKELIRYFEDFSARAEAAGVRDWILDPGLGFAKTEEHNWEILENLEQLKVFGRPVLIGASNKRFTRGDSEKANRLALEHGADILRVHI